MWTRTQCWYCKVLARKVRLACPNGGRLPIPPKLLRQGVRDMLRVSDARMSGTSYGACVLHVTPESHVGRATGPGARW